MESPTTVKPSPVLQQAEGSFAGMACWFPGINLSLTAKKEDSP